MLRNFSLRYKILLTIIGVTIGALCFVTILFATQNLSDYRDLTELILKINNSSNLIVDALKTNNVTASTEALEELEANPNITDARIFGYKENVFLPYGARDKSIPSLLYKIINSPRPIFLLEKNSLKIAYPIFKNEQLQNVLYVSTNLENTIGIKNLIELIILLSLVSIFFAIQLEDITLKPLSNLVEGIKNVKLKNDFSIQVKKERNDEIGDLVDEFNAMLASIKINEKLQMEKEVVEKLIQAEKKASLEKSLFLADMSHEIRTPLNGVIGMVQLMNLTSLTNDQRNMIEIIKISGETLMSVINNILDLSKIEAGKLELEKIQFNLANVISEVIEMGAIRAHQKGVDIAAFIENNVPVNFIGDKVKLRQILNNLISNAIKFTHHGHVNLLIAFVNENKPKLIFKISDTGIGMSNEVQVKLFQAFSQGEISTSRQYGGTGLGLNISKRLIELMEGNITVESVPEKGTQFSFYIHLDVSEEIEKTSKIIHEFSQLNKSRILCFDENPQNAKIIQQLVEPFGANTDIASDKSSLIELLDQSQAQPYTVIFVDYFMSGEINTELLKTLKNKVPETTKIILMCHLGKNPESHYLSEFNISAILTKPLTTKKIYDCLFKIFDMLQKNVVQSNPEIDHVERQPSTTKLLLVEDDYVNQLVASGMLNKLGYKAEIVANGVDAIKAVKNKVYDIILMDCEMPEFDGFETTRRIRQLEKPFNRHANIIAMTAHVLISYKEKCIASGMDDYISKPIDIKLLEEKLAFWLAKD